MITAKLTPEQAIKEASYPEEEDINGSPLIVSQMVALSQIEHARQEERNIFTKKIIIAGHEKTRNYIENHFYMGIFYGWITGFIAGAMFFIFPIYSVIIGIGIIFLKSKFESNSFRNFVTQSKKGEKMHE